MWQPKQSVSECDHVGEVVMATGLNLSQGECGVRLGLVFEFSVPTLPKPITLIAPPNHSAHYNRFFIYEKLCTIITVTLLAF